MADAQQDAGEPSNKPELAPEVEETIASTITPILQELPKKQQAKMQAAVTAAITTISSYYQGPMPPPSDLREYDAIIEQGAERMMQRFEIQSIHRQHIEAQLVNLETTATLRGQWMAFVIVLVLAGIGAVGMLLDKTAVALTIFATTILGVSAFAVGRSFVQNRSSKSAPPTPPTPPAQNQNRRPGSSPKKRYR